jgi:predicted DNA-binding helix-hairpin-helix protein
VSVEEKLQALGGLDALYDGEGASAARLPLMRKAPVGGIFYAQAGGGRCIPLLRVLMTNVCENDCRYCSINCHRSVRRTAFRPEELARTFMDMWRSLVRGPSSAREWRRAAKIAERMLTAGEIPPARGFAATSTSRSCWASPPITSSGR